MICYHFDAAMQLNFFSAINFTRLLCVYKFRMQQTKNNNRENFKFNLN